MKDLTQIKDKVSKMKDSDKKDRILKDIEAKKKFKTVRK